VDVKAASCARIDRFLADFSGIVLSDNGKIKIDRDESATGYTGHLADYMVWATAPLGVDVLTGAWELQDRHSVGFWDALLLASASAARCKHFLTEELNDGQLYGDVRVVDPFRHAPEDVLGRARP
jgi:hypothetical protein